MTFDYLHAFTQDISSIPLPERFTWPYHYEPHPLCQLAAEELKEYLRTQTDWQHDFGLDHYVEGPNVGKMFGVMVVMTPDDKVRYLQAFSGKLAERTDLPGFVPPIAEILADDGFFRRGEAAIMAVSRRLEDLQNSTDLEKARLHRDEVERNSEAALDDIKAKLAQAKAERDCRRDAAREQLDDAAYAELEKELQQQSKEGHFELNDAKRLWRQKRTAAVEAHERLVNEIDGLKRQRRKMSAALQDQIFDQYRFLNAHGEWREVRDLFAAFPQKVPPSGAGDCATPKLLQHAYLHGLKPLAFAEFWWGQAPVSEIRHHGQFYPACKGKCLPILTHMLQGLEVEHTYAIVSEDCSDAGVCFHAFSRGSRGHA